jgi:hypothetical protein
MSTARRIAPSNMKAISKDGFIEEYPLGLFEPSGDAIENNAPVPIEDKPTNSNNIPDIIERIAIIVMPRGLLIFLSS